MSAASEQAELKRRYGGTVRKGHAKNVPGIPPKISFDGWNDRGFSIVVLCYACDGQGIGFTFDQDAALRMAQQHFDDKHRKRWHDRSEA